MGSRELREAHGVGGNEFTMLYTWSNNGGSNTFANFDAALATVEKYGAAFSGANSNIKGFIEGGGQIYYKDGKEGYYVSSWGVGKNDAARGNPNVNFYLSAFSRIETWVGFEEAPHTQPALNWQENERIREQQKYDSFMQQSKGMTPQSGRIESVPFFFEVLSGGTSSLVKQATKLVAKKAAAKGMSVAKHTKSWLGKDYKVITNKARDNIFMSKDGLRKMRFDINNPHGDAPHIHLEIFKNGKWTDAIPGTHRIYPKP